MKGTGYRVSFSKNVISSDGHPYKCLQDVIVVTANTQDEGVTVSRGAHGDPHRKKPLLTPNRPSLLDRLTIASTVHLIRYTFVQGTPWVRNASCGG